MNERDARAGMLLMIATMLVFALQDGISRHLAAEYNVYMVVMVRYWFFAAFAIAMAARMAGGLRRAAASSRPVVQGFRAVLLAAEICVMVYGFTLLGLVESHAVFACYPLITAALAGPLLGEHAGWRRWLAIAAGFIGVIVILDPGAGVFRPVAVIPLLSAAMFALYSLLTRFVSRGDSAATTFLWTGAVGAVAMTAVGMWFWEGMTAPDWAWMAVLCASGALGHYMLIKCYELSEASALQPFAYFHLVFVSILGVFVFGEILRPNVVLGTAIVVGAGLFTLWRSRRAQQRAESRRKDARGP